jgi:hypothetical protein
MSHGELLRDHPAEADAHQTAALPARGIEHRDRVLGEIGHRIWRCRWRASAEPTVIPCEQLQPLADLLELWPYVVNRHPGAVAEQQPRAAARLLPIELSSI